MEIEISEKQDNVQMKKNKLSKQGKLTKIFKICLMNLTICGYFINSYYYRKTREIDKFSIF